jgi:hypothetical protein
VSWRPAYQKVINAYSLKAIDIDIEADAYSNPTVQQRTVDALKTVRGQQRRASSCTSPSAPASPARTTSLMNRAASSGLTVDAWTIMPFDFGGAGPEHGHAHPASGRRASRTSLKNAYGYNDDTAYRDMGISSMNGITDNSETVTTADFKTILGYANRRITSRG